MEKSKKQLTDSFISQNEYLDTSYLLYYLEGILGKSIDEIEYDIEHAVVYATKEQAQRYLNILFCYEDIEMKRRVQKGKYGNDLGQQASDRIYSKRYKYYKKAGEYYERYLQIEREKLTKILNIIKAISFRDADSIKDQLEELDIVLKDNNDEEYDVYDIKYILESDVLRLVKPFVYLYRDLMAKWKEANDLESYATPIFGADVPLDSSHFRDESLQAPSRFENDTKEEYISYTSKQLKIKKKQDDEAMTSVCNFFKKIGI